MHYQNGREAKNGDQVVLFEATSGAPVAVGTLLDATPGNDYCNGSVAVRLPGSNKAELTGACLVDCLHIEDVEKHPRPAGK